jgi:hypothetical protein
VIVTHAHVPASPAAVTVGRPDANVHCYVVDPATLQPLPPGSKGELLLAGPRLAAGYIGRDAAPAFIPNPCAEWALDAVPGEHRRHYDRAYRTGDVARWTPGGELEILGRADRQVKVRGVRIELGEVEAALAGAPGVAAAAAEVRLDPRAGGGAGAKRLVGWVVCPGGADAGAVLGHCAAVLVSAAVPAALVAVAALPTSATGKVDYAQLPDPPAWSAAPAEEDAAAAPLDEVAAAVAAAWGRALALPGPLPADADFFAEGGTSLAALRASAELQKELGLAAPPSIAALYDARTPRLMGAVLRALRAAAPGAAAPPPLAPRPWQGNVRPLSAGQEVMWTVAAMIGPERSAAYAVPAAFRIAGPLDVAALRAALAALAERHESLRTRFALHRGATLRGIVEAAGGFRLAPREVAVADEGAAMRAAILAECAAPFDLEAGPLARAALLRPPAADVAVLVFTMHHSVSDGWSKGVVCHELSAAYAAAAAGAPAAAALPPLAATYADFVVWQRAAAEAVGPAQLEFWRGALAGAPAMLTLPSDRPRPAEPSFGGATILGPRLPPALLARLRAVASSLHCSPAALFLAGFHAVLARLAGQDDVVVGVAVAGRGLPEAQPLIGYFVNPVSVRARVDPAAPFSALCRAVRDALAAAADNDVLPFQQVVTALGADGGDYNPLFQASAPAAWHRLAPPFLLCWPLRPRLMKA